MESTETKAAEAADGGNNPGLKLYDCKGLS